MPLRLGNQTVIVRGKYAALLMDFSRGAMQRISLGAADLIDELVEQDTESDRTLLPAEVDVVSKLEERSFLHHVRARRSRKFSVDWNHPVYPVVRTLSVEFSGMPIVHMDRLLECLLQWHRTRGILNVAIFCIEAEASAVGSIVATILERSERLIVDLVVPESRKAEFIDIFKASDERVQVTVAPMDNIPGSKFFSHPFVSKASFFCRQDFYHLTKAASESYGCLHIDRNGDIWPDPMESHFKVGEMGSVIANTLDVVLEQSIPYWKANKIGRSKCGDCEYRFVCPNPASTRVDPLDLDSEPGNCRYSPEVGAWT